MCINKRLQQLISTNEITELELSRRTGVAQPIINRLVSGENKNPKIATLKPLAKFFCVTVSQLIGDESLDKPNRPDVQQSEIQRVPIFRLKHFEKNQDLTQLNQMTTRFTIYEHPVEANIFACEIEDDHMLPLCSKGSLLIFKQACKAEHKHYVLIKQAKTNHIILRQLHEAANQLILMPLNPLKEMTIITMTEQDQVFGILMQAKKNYY
jgi:transcriptional regulator with XRE-family HTH domain